MFLGGFFLPCLLRARRFFRLGPPLLLSEGLFPQGVVESLKLEQGDTLNWSIEVKEGKIVAVVEKAEAPASG